MIKLYPLLKEDDLTNKITELIFNSNDESGFVEALRLKYGNTIPLYHATTIEKSKLIDRDGLKLVYGRNYKNMQSEKILYFQIGKSDYRADNRPIVYKYDASIEFIAKYAEADVDGVDVKENDLIKLGINIKNISSEARDFIMAYINNNYQLDGIELIIRTGWDDENFPIIRPIKIAK